MQQCMQLIKGLDPSIHCLNCENESFNICETVESYSHQTISDLNMNFSSWSFSWLMADLCKFQAFFLFLFLLVYFVFCFFGGVGGGYAGFRFRNHLVTQLLSPILLTVPIKQELLLIAFAFPIIIVVVCQLKAEFQAFWQFWKIINLNRILERYNGKVGEGLLRARISSYNR